MKSWDRRVTLMDPFKFFTVTRPGLGLVNLVLDTPTLSPNRDHKKLSTTR